MSIVPAVLALTSPPPFSAGACPTGRFATPPWNPDSPDWQRLDQELPADHLARRIDRAVAFLDLSDLFDGYAGTGSPAHRPDLLLNIALYERQRGERSPNQWVEDARYHTPLQWLAWGLRPSRSRLYAFRDRLGPRLSKWQQHLVAQALTRNLTTGQQASLDGTTIAADASRHRLLNESQRHDRQEQWAEAITADAADAPPPPPPGWMASTPRGRVQQHPRYQNAQSYLQQRQAAHQRRPKSKRQAAHAVRISISDPEAALGWDKFKVYRPLDNVHLVCDLNSPLVLGYDVFAQPTDAGTLPRMLPHVPTVQELLTDAGYATAFDLVACAEARVTLYAPYQENDFSAAKRAAGAPKQLPKSAFTWWPEAQTYQCPQGQRLVVDKRERQRRGDNLPLQVTTYRCPGEHCRACPLRQQCARDPETGRTIQRHEHEALVEAWRARMQTAAAKALYRRRSQTVELGFADLKEHRGLRRFRGRGRERARIQVGLTVLAHNLLVVAAAVAKSATEPPSTTRVKIAS
jgi:transposase